MSKKRDPLTSAEMVSADPIPPGRYNPLRLAEERTRNRCWEREHQSQKVTYRGVEPKLAWKVKVIAGGLQVPEGEVARTLIEHALRAYERGELDLYPQPDPQRTRMTLYPSPGPARFSNRRKKSKHSKGGWRVITTWRGFPPELKGELSALASDAGLNIPSGELVSALLRHGLQAYENGWLKLEVVPSATTVPLVQEGQK